MNVYKVQSIHSLSVCICLTGSSCGGWEHRADSQSDAGGEKESLCQERCGTSPCRYSNSKERIIKRW